MRSTGHAGAVRLKIATVARCSGSSQAERASMLMPQGLDAQQGGELFPVCLLCRARCGCPCQPQRLAIREAVHAPSPRFGIRSRHALSPRCRKLASSNLGKPQGGGDGSRNFGTRHSRSSPTQNRQRATMQTPPPRTRVIARSGSSTLRLIARASRRSALPRRRQRRRQRNATTRNRHYGRAAQALTA